MSEIKRYKSHDIVGQPWPDTSFVTEKDHEADCQRRIAEAVAAERERCRREEVKPIKDALASAMATAAFEHHPFRPWHKEADDAMAEVIDIQRQSPAPDTRADRLLAAVRPVLRAANGLRNDARKFVSLGHDIETYNKALAAYEKAKEGL